MQTGASAPPRNKVCGAPSPAQTPLSELRAPSGPRFRRPFEKPLRRPAPFARPLTAPQNMAQRDVRELERATASASDEAEAAISSRLPEAARNWLLNAPFPAPPPWHAPEKRPGGVRGGAALKDPTAATFSIRSLGPA